MSTLATAGPEGPVLTKEVATHQMEKITKDMRIGEVMKRHPETRKVFVRYFGGNCFACPGVEKEDIYFGSKIHNVDMAQVLEDLNRAIEKRPENKDH